MLKLFTDTLIAGSTIIDVGINATVFSDTNNWLHNVDDMGF